MTQAIAGLATIDGMCERPVEAVPCPYCRRGIDEPGRLGSGLSWGGFVVVGNSKSITEVRRLLDVNSYVEALRERLKVAERALAGRAALEAASQGEK